MSTKHEIGWVTIKGLDATTGEPVTWTAPSATVRLHRIGPNLRPVLDLRADNPTEERA